MKFIDTFTNNDKERLIKKAKLIFSVLKKGTITRSDGVSFSYELGDNMVPEVVDGEMVIFAFITKIKEITYCPINEIAMTDLIIKKFDNFNIKADLYTSKKTTDIEKFQGKKPWEVETTEPINESEEEKIRNKVRTVHKALRKGVVTLKTGDRFRYELPENYKIFITEDEQVSIQFTFRIDDVTIENGGLNLPLKVWKIVDGKDESINEPLNGHQINHIIYGDPLFTSNELIINYANVKNKVKNKYLDFNINSIMLDPSDEMINESVGEEERLIKKAKTIFKIFKSRTIGGPDSNYPKFRYELSDDISINVRNQNEINVFTPKVKIIELNRACKVFSAGYFDTEIRKIFKQYDIILGYPYLTSDDIEQGYETINEGAELLNPDSLSDYEIKKVKLIYNTFKTGKFVYDEHSTYMYILPDDYYIYRDELDDICVMCNIKEGQDIQVFGQIGNYKAPVKKHLTGLQGWIRQKIVNKFDTFNIKFIP